MISSGGKMPRRKTNAPSGMSKQLSERKIGYVCYTGLCNTLVAIFINCTIVVTLLPGVLALPRVDVTTDASSTSTKEGDTVSLTCLITGLTPAETINYVKWKKSGITFTDLNAVAAADPLGRYSVEGTVESTFQAYTFRIANVQTQDSGLYTCHVGFTDGNNLPNEISKSLQMSIIYYTPPDTSPYCQTASNVTNLNVGAFISLICSTQKGNPTVNITWTRKTQSGLTEEIPLTQRNYGTDLARLTHDFNISQEHNANEFICGIRSEVFPDFQRNCSIGPLVVIDIPLRTTGGPLQTTLHGPSPWIPSTKSASTGSFPPTRATHETITNSNDTSSNINISPGLTLPSNSTSPNTTTTTTTTAATTYASTTTTTTKSSSTTTSADGFNITELSRNATTSKDLPETTPNGASSPSDGFALSLLAIIGMSAGGLILFFLICNVIMLVRMFTCQRRKIEHHRSLRSRQSVQRANRIRGSIGGRFSDIDEETEA